MRLLPGRQWLRGAETTWMIGTAAALACPRRCHNSSISSNSINNDATSADVGSQPERRLAEVLAAAQAVFAIGDRSADHANSKNKSRRSNYQEERQQRQRHLRPAVAIQGSRSGGSVVATLAGPGVSPAPATAAPAATNSMRTTAPPSAVASGAGNKKSNDLARRSGTALALPLAEDASQQRRWAEALQAVEYAAAVAPRAALADHIDTCGGSGGGGDDVSSPSLRSAVRRLMLSALHKPEQQQHQGQRREPGEVRHDGTAALSPSLERRAARGYLGLLAGHGLRPASRAEWRALCGVLSVAGGGRGAGPAVAVLPLLPSSLLPVNPTDETTARVGGGELARAELRALSATLSWQEALAVLQWGLHFNSHVNSGDGGHVSSRDIQMVLARLAQDTGSREDGGGVINANDGKEANNNGGDGIINGSDDAVAERLAGLWARARGAEQADRCLAAACGIDRTAHGGIELRGRRLVPSSSSAAAAVTASSNDGKDVGDSHGHVAAAAQRHTNISSDKDPRAFNELLLMGQWPRVLESIVATATTECTEQHRQQGQQEQRRNRVDRMLCQSLPSNDSSSSSGSRSVLSILQCFFSGSDKGGIDTVVPLYANPRRALRLRLPPSMAAAAACAAAPNDVAALAAPPCAALQELSDAVLAAAGGPSADGGGDKARERTEAAVARGLAAMQTHGTSNTTTGLTPSPPPVVAELRRRLWVLSQLPRHIPRSLVRFQSYGKSSASDHHQHRTQEEQHQHAMHHRKQQHHHLRNHHHHYSASSSGSSAPCLVRSQPHELAAWLLAATVGLAVRIALAEWRQQEQRQEQDPTAHATVAELLAEVRLAVAPVLLSPRADYAAFTDYTYNAFVHLSTAVAEVEVGRLALRRREQQQDSDHDGDDDSGGLTLPLLAGAVSVAEATVFESAQILLMPPPPQTDVTTTASALVRCSRNHLTSAYLEVLAQLAPSLDAYAAAVAAVTDPTITTRTRTEQQGSAPSVPEVPEVAAVVLSPEAAATVTTALVLRLLPEATAAAAALDGANASIRSSSSDCSALAAVCAAVAPPHGRLHFALPADKAHAAASYFRSIHDPSFLHYDDEEEVEEGDWNGAEALLLGRSLRVVSRYPTTTTEAFLSVTITTTAATAAAHGEDGSVGDAGVVGVAAESRAPQLRWRLCSVDLPAAVAFFAAKSARETAATASGSSGSVLVACGRLNTINSGDASGFALPSPPPPPLLLPYGLGAVSKAAGVSTTLHAGYPSLVSHLMALLPWQQQNENQQNVGGSGLSRSSVAVRHQHGLVNRIDAGTSGLVLAAQDGAGLHQGRLNTLARHRVSKVYRALAHHCPLTHDNVNVFNRINTPAATRHQQQQQQRNQRREKRRGSMASQMQASQHHGGGGGGGGCYHDGLAVRGAHPPPPPQMWYLPRIGVVSAPVAAGGSNSSSSSSAHNKSRSTAAAVAALDQRPALTHYRVIEHFPTHGVYYLELRLSSGRKHQIRQHMARVQHPLLGDSRYHPAVAGGGRGRRCGDDHGGSGTVATTTTTTSDVGGRGTSSSPAITSVHDLLSRPALHAVAVNIIGETAQEGVTVQCPLPPDMLAALRWLRRHR